MHEQLNLDVYLTSDDVIAATRDTMEETICYIQEKYIDAAGYMHEVSTFSLSGFVYCLPGLQGSLVELAWASGIGAC